MSKKIYLSIVTMITVLSLNVVFASNNIRVFINENQIEFDTSPEIINDRMFVPLRAIAEALKSTVTWEDESNIIHITKGDATTILSIGNMEVKKQTADKTETSILEAAPYIKDNRTMVPLRFISESFGMDVDWDGENQSVFINAAVEAEQSADLAITDKVLYYTDFATVPDFGSCFGYEDEYIDGTHFYSDTQEEDRKEYINLLEALGFEKVDEMVNSQVESYGYEKDGIQVVAALFGIEGMNGIYAIRIQNKVEEFEGDIKYYEDYKSVPDCSSLDMVKLSDTSKVAENITEYLYTVSNADDLQEVLIQYTNMLQQSGFSVVLQTINGAMYTNDETENTVIIGIGSNNDDKIVISIIVEQWEQNK